MRCFLATVVLFLAFSSQAFAVENFFIPNYYKNRPTMNTYSAIGWSDRHDVGAEMTYATTGFNNNGVRSSDDKFTDVNPFIFYRLPNNLNIEFTGNLGNDKDTQAGNSYKTTENEYQGSLGYEFTNIPLAIGASYSAETDATTDPILGNVTTQFLHQYSVGAGYRLPGEYYVGAGFRDQDNLNGRTDLSSRFYYVGGGRVWGDKKTPDAAMEAFLDFYNNDGTQHQGVTARGLINSGALQYYGAAAYGVASGKRSGSNYDVRLGVDYEYMHFYVGPEIFTTNTKTDADNQADVVRTSLSLEAGYRIAMLTAYVRYGNVKNTSSEDGSFSNLSSDYLENTYTAGFIYHF